MRLRSLDLDRAGKSHGNATVMCGENSWSSSEAFRDVMDSDQDLRGRDLESRRPQGHVSDRPRFTRLEVLR